MRRVLLALPLATVLFASPSPVAAQAWPTGAAQRQQQRVRLQRHLASRRGQAKQRFNQWREMPPEQRQQLRERYQRFKNLPPEQQARVRESFKRFRQLPPEKRMELRKRWKQLTPEQRRRRLNRCVTTGKGANLLRRPTS